MATQTKPSASQNQQDPPPPPDTNIENQKAPEPAALKQPDVDLETIELSTERFPYLRLQCLELVTKHLPTYDAKKAINHATRYFDFVLTDKLEYRAFRRLDCLRNASQLGHTQIEQVLADAAALSKWVEGD